MKNLRTLLFAFAAIAATTTFTACSDNGKDDTPPAYENEADASKWYFQGDVKVTQTDGSVYTHKDVVTTLDFNKTANTCVLYMDKVSFAAAMPMTIDMEIHGLSSINSSGSYRITGNNIVPIATGYGERPAYLITEFSGNASTKTFSFTTKVGDNPDIPNNTVYPMTFSGNAYEMK